MNPRKSDGLLLVSTKFVMNSLVRLSMYYACGIRGRTDRLSGQLLLLNGNRKAFHAREYLSCQCQRYKTVIRDADDVLDTQEMEDYDPQKKLYADLWWRNSLSSPLQRILRRNRTGSG